MRRGISEKSVRVVNPLPNTTEAELFTKAKLTLFREPTDLPPFEMVFQYSGGDEREVVCLKPGQQHVMRASDANDMMREKGEMGLVLLELNDPAESVHSKTMAGLLRGYRFYQERGHVRVIAWRQTHGLTAEETEERRHEIWQYHVNQAKADVIEEAMKALRKSVAKAA